MKAKIILILSFLLILSCSPQRKLKRLIRKYPELTQNDTIVFRDTFYIKEVRVDTAILLSNLHDTIIIIRDNLEIIANVFNDTLYITGRCLGDTIYIESKIPVSKIVYVKESGLLKSIGKASWLALILLAILIVWKYRKRSAN
jgi:hypothetical protein